LIHRLEDEPANYRLSQHFDVVHLEEFPRSATGKVVREAVEEWNVGGESRVREG
jgi:hypothetical protein